jgi:uncharacterized membrane protein
MSTNLVAARLFSAFAARTYCTIMLLCCLLLLILWLAVCSVLNVSSNRLSGEVPATLAAAPMLDAERLAGRRS